MSETKKLICLHLRRSWIILWELNRLGFSSRVMQTFRAGYKLDKDEILEMATNWLKARTDAGFFNVHPSELGSIDFTFTSQRTYRPRSYSRRGG
jgi:hypothetical protein